MIPLEFVVFGIPISTQAKSGSTSKRRWMTNVAATAQSAVPEGANPVGHNLLIQVVYYFTGEPLDVDNMLKPILDSMNGIVFVDDKQVTDIRAAKRDLSGTFELEFATEALESAISGGADFVHIRVENAPDPKGVL